MNEEAVLAVALDKKSAAERAAFLEHACQGNPLMRQRVEERLKSHDEAGSHLEATHAPSAAPSSPLGERAGSRIGPYKLLQQLGEGGMGAVWAAEQSEPVKRRVALKLIKPGMDSTEVIRRFEQERQSLAMMDHSNIAKVLDAGTTHAGRPFFVMEFVNGVPITKYCDELNLPLRERLALFVPVCQAIQHAHQKGIIHRDIKPSNVLIALQDGKPVPKVIDFGVAKALHQGLADRSMYTEIGAVIGTLEYMSPEQAELSTLDIDTRADVYALGVLLYELLTGTTPLNRKQLQQAAFTEILRMIREVEPPKPSTRISAAQDSLASVAAQRRLEPARLTKAVRGELDWIVMKCLEKDRTRRYESAIGLARDVDRYLNDEAVEASPPSAIYRTRKFLRRNKGPVLAALLVLLTLIGGIIGTTWGLFAANRSRTLAEAKEKEARDAAVSEVAQRKLAEAATAAEKKAKEAEAEQRRQAELDRLAARAAERVARESEADTEAFSNFLVEDVLSAARPEGDRGGLGIGVTVRQALDVAALQIAERFRDRPRAEAIARHSLGVTYRLVGELEASETQLREAQRLRQETLGLDHAATLDTQNSLSVLLIERGKTVEALSLIEKTLKLLEAKLPSNDSAVLRARGNLASAYQDVGKFELAIEIFESTLKDQELKLGPNHPMTLDNRNNLAMAYREAGKLSLALPLLESTLVDTEAILGEEHPDTLTSRNNLALAYQESRKLDLAIPLFERTLMSRVAKQGDNHQLTLTARNNLACAYDNAGKYDLAIPLYERTLKEREAKLGNEHHETLITRSNLAGAYLTIKKFPEAIALYEQNRDIKVKQLGSDHPEVISLLSKLASAYRAGGKLSESIDLLKQVWDSEAKRRGAEHPTTLAIVANLAAAYKADGNFPQAIELFEQVRDVRMKNLGANHPSTQLTLNNLAGAYRAAGKLEQALPLYAQAVEGIEKQGFQHQNSAQIVENLIDCYEDLKQYGEAETWRRKWLALVKERDGAESSNYAAELSRLGVNLLVQKRWSDAEQPLRESLTIREATMPTDWITFNVQSLIGEALARQKQYVEAEPLLLSGYNGMKSREATIPPRGKIRLIEAMDRLVQLYDALGKTDEAAKWRKELEAAKAAAASAKLESKP